MTRFEDREGLLRWLRASHEALRGAMLALPDDSALDEARRVHWGEGLRLRDILAGMVAHDTYHAGEINHARALLQRDDAWFRPSNP